jgi:Cu2+-exporting ATPase
MKTTHFAVPDIHCSGCAASIEKALEGVEGVKAVRVDVEEKCVAVDHDDALLSPESIETRLDHIGFPAKALPGS